jgi:hypothetical protein
MYADRRPSLEKPLDALASQQPAHHTGERMETTFESPSPTLVGLPDAMRTTVAHAPASTDAEEVEAIVAGEDAETEPLLADLDRATESLTVFRKEISRLVALQRATEADLRETRHQLAELEAKELEDRKRFESELSRERHLTTLVRAKLGELVATLDAH